MQVTVTYSSGDTEVYTDVSSHDVKNGALTIVGKAPGDTTVKTHVLNWALITRYVVE